MPASCTKRLSIYFEEGKNMPSGETAQTQTLILLSYSSATWWTCGIMDARAIRKISWYRSVSLLQAKQWQAMQGWGDNVEGSPLVIPQCCCSMLGGPF